MNLAASKFLYFVLETICVLMTVAIIFPCGRLLIFLAAKRSSTRALVPLSVCLSVVKPEFLIVWSAYDNLDRL